MQKNNLIDPSTHSWYEKYNQIQLEGNFSNLVTSIYRKFRGSIILNCERLNTFPLWSQIWHRFLFMYLPFNIGSVIHSQANKYSKVNKRHINQKRRNKAFPIYR